MRGRLAACLLAVVVSTGVMVTPAGAATGRPAQPDASSCAVEQADAQGQLIPGSTPVLFVHGLDSSPGIWEEGPGTSLPEQVAELPGVTAWMFDYSSVAVDWVTNPQIGPALASAITCLAMATGKQVIVVAHSMGGLATQFAVSQTGSDGALVATHVAKVITIGTPTKGSLSGAIAVAGLAGVEYAVGTLGGAGGKALAAGVEALHSACAGAIIANPQGDACGWFGLDETQAGRDLLYGSAALSALPPWPSGLPVIAMAGNITVSIGVGSLRTEVSLGDVVVSLGSATAYDTDGAPFIDDCPDVTVIGLYEQTSPCYHHNLPYNPRIDAAVLAEIREGLNLPVSGTQVATTVNGAPIVGPDGRLWGIEGGTMNTVFGAINPQTGATQNYPVNYVPADGGVIEEVDGFAFDGSGDIWLSAMQRPGASTPPSASLPLHVLIRYTVATGKATGFPVPQACMNVGGTLTVVPASDGSVWLVCEGTEIGYEIAYRVTPDGTATPVHVTSGYYLEGIPAEGLDGEMWMNVYGGPDITAGVAEFDGTGLVAFHPGKPGTGIGAIQILGNGTGHLPAQVNCASAFPSTDVCFGEQFPDGTADRFATVHDVSTLGPLAMDSQGNLWAVVELTRSQTQDDLLEVSSAGQVTLHPIAVTNAGIPSSFTPSAPPAIAADGSVWIPNPFSAGLLKFGPF
jgi:pimeloyl-ACP methyl ester carboxylesterase